MTRARVRIPERPEASIEAAACERIQTRWPEVLIRKLSGAGDRNWPDRMILVPKHGSGHGHTLFIEFKKPGEGPTPGQLWMMKELREAGFEAAWVTSVDQAELFVQDCIRSHL